MKDLRVIAAKRWVPLFWAFTGLELPRLHISGKLISERKVTFMLREPHLRQVARNEPVAGRSPASPNHSTALS